MVACGIDIRCLGRTTAALWLGAGHQVRLVAIVTLQDLGSIGELIGAVATAGTLVYLAIQIRHNSRSLEQNTELMRLSFENHIREEGTDLRALIASDQELASIWRRGLAGATDLEQSERDRFELLVVNVLNMLGAQYDARNRGLAASNRATYLFFIARTPGFREWWRRKRDVGGDVGFGRWMDSLTEAGPDDDLPAA